jgi:predicted  nucleic acid-binding Zn-ribbon protein
MNIALRFLIVTCALALLLAPGSGWAASTTNGGSTPSGKPFSYLQTQIAADQSAISALQADTTALKAGLAEVWTALNALTARVSSNEASIQSLFGNVKDLRSTVQAQGKALQVAGAQLAVLRTDVNANADAIAAAQANINSMQDTLHTQVDALNAQNAAMALTVAAVQADLVQFRGTVAAQETAIKAQIADLQAQIDQINVGLANTVGMLTLEQLSAALLTASNLGNQIQSLNMNLQDLRAAYENHTHTFQDIWNVYTQTVLVQNAVYGTYQVWEQVGTNSVFVCDFYFFGCVSGHYESQPVYAWVTYTYLVSPAIYETRTYFDTYPNTTSAPQ